MTLSDKLHQEIVELCEEGNVFIEMGDFENAFKNFSSALGLVPEPKEDYEATLWVLTAIGDVYFLTQSFEQGLEVFTDCMHLYGAIGNPFLHLRLGQIQLELGNEAKAADELCRAYMGAGKEIFDEDNPKYFDFLKTKMEKPESGEW